jgi:biopolymer transport protein ExbB
MIPIAILGFIGLYVFIERLLTIRKAGRIDRNFMNQIRDMVTHGNIDAALMLCKNTDTPVARMMEKGVSHIGKPFDDIRGAIENEGNLEVFKLERNMTMLATVAGGAPMLGFLGTVTGMITAFHNISLAQSAVSPGLVAGGIYEALVTTAGGLFIGVPAYFGYNHLTNMIDKVIFRMEATTVEFIDLLEQPV